MMDEYVIIYQITGGAIAIVISAMLYSLGGRNGKWKRRFVGSFIASATVNILCLMRGIWAWPLLLTWPLISIGYSLGYGKEGWLKYVQRTIYATTVCSAGLACAFALGGNAFWLLIPHFGIGLFSIYLGTKNPIAAAAEEFIISLLLTLMLLGYPFLS